MIESELMCGILFKTCFLRGAYPNNSGFCQGQLIVHTFVALMTITCGRFGCNSPKLSVVIMLLVTEIAERASKATRKNDPPFVTSGSRIYERPMQLLAAAASAASFLWLTDFPTARCVQR